MGACSPPPPSARGFRFHPHAEDAQACPSHPDISPGSGHRHRPVPLVAPQGWLPGMLSSSGSRQPCFPPTKPALPTASPSLASTSTGPQTQALSSFICTYICQLPHQYHHNLPLPSTCTPHTRRCLDLQDSAHTPHGLFHPVLPEGACEHFSWSRPFLLRTLQCSHFAQSKSSSPPAAHKTLWDSALVISLPSSPLTHRNISLLTVP